MLLGSACGGIVKGGRGGSINQTLSGGPQYVVVLPLGNVLVALTTGVLVAL